MVMVVLLAALQASAQQPDSTEAIARSLIVTRSINYPQAAEDAGIEGTVLVEFTIDRLCTIKNKRVIRGLGYGLDEEALKVIDRKYEDALTHALMPCTPDTLVLPIKFKIR
jgi:protein TonB